MPAAETCGGGNNESSFGVELTIVAALTLQLQREGVTCVGTPPATIGAFWLGKPKPPNGNNSSKELVDRKKHQPKM